MQIGTLVKLIEFEYIGVVIDEDDSFICIHWSDNEGSDWYSECELEVICK